MSDTVGSVLAQKGGKIWFVEPDASVYEAIAMMMDKGVGALLVLSHGALVGIVSERDYARKVILQGRSSKDTPVSEIMTSPVKTVSPEHTVDACMRIMTEDRIRHLPVIAASKVIGIVSIGDLVKTIIAKQAHTIGQLQTYISGAYPT
jgi:CBS domain-containing protein